MNYWKDEDTGVTHINTCGGDITLCGIQRGWTMQGDTPDKKKWGCTCSNCQEELEELRTIKK